MGISLLGTESAKLVGKAVAYAKMKRLAMNVYRGTLIVSPSAKSVLNIARSVMSLSAIHVKPGSLMTRCWGVYLQICAKSKSTTCACFVILALT